LPEALACHEQHPGGFRCSVPDTSALYSLIKAKFVSAGTYDPDDRAALIAMAERRIADPGAPIDDLAVGLGPEGRSLFELLTNRDPERVVALIARLPFTVQRHLESLSLRHLDLSRLAGRLILIHGLDDTMIPHTESKALTAAAGPAPGRWQ